MEYQSFPQQKLIPEYGRNYLQINQGEKKVNGFFFIPPIYPSTNTAYSYHHPQIQGILFIVRSCRGIKYATQNVAPWHVDYFHLILFKTHKTQVFLLAFPANWQKVFRYKTFSKDGMITIHYSESGVVDREEVSKPYLIKVLFMPIISALSSKYLFAKCLFLPLLL